jgi:hypothetical protein
MAHNCKKFRWPIEDSINVHDTVSANHATNRTLLLDRKLTEFLRNSWGGSQRKSRIAIFKFGVEVLIGEAVRENGLHRVSARFRDMKEYQDLGLGETGNTGSPRAEQH